MWKNLSGTTKFSIVAFILTMALGLLSMGALGYALYYLVAPVLDKDIDSLQGDSTWPTVIAAGMAWSFGFIWSGLAFHFLRKRIGEFMSYLIYVLILWIWLWMLWYCFLNFNVVQ